jgi:regulator of protease activity HflC (stomatin/prohibitin superfamily)
MRKVKFLLVAVIAIYAAAFLTVNIVKVVRPGEAAAIEFMGSVNQRSYSNGPVFVYPGSKVVKFNVREQKYAYKMNMKLASMQDVTISGALNFSLSADNVHRLYQEVGEDYKPVIITPLLEGAFNETIGKQSPEFIVSSPEMIREAVLYILKDQLEPTELLEISDLRLFKPTFDKKFEEAIKDKAVAMQVAEKAKIETRRVEEEAAQMKKKMEAEAYGLNLKSKALSNPLIVRYEFAKAMGKWEGKLPNTLVVGQNGAMPVLPLSK